MTVNVAANLSQEEPVTQTEVSAALRHITVPRHPAGDLTQGPLSRPHRDDGENPPDHLDGGHCGEEDKPEPEHDVDLLVDDVEREDAESVNLLDSS